MFQIHTTGNWSRGAVSVRVVPSTRRIVPEVEDAIERAWRAGKLRLGSRLFDGSMCRMESSEISGDALALGVSLTGYRIFYGTNLNSEVMQRFGTDVCANSLGVSSALHTQDNWLLFGKRNASVAYHPNRVHPFAGCLEEKDLRDVFAAAERELQEELNLSAKDIESIHCIGIAEDTAIRQPELIFHTRLKLTRKEVESQIRDEEHRGSVAIHADPAAIDEALHHPADFTPIALATLTLCQNRLA